jgi:hypothetical protein
LGITMISEVPQCWQPHQYPVADAFQTTVEESFRLFPNHWDEENRALVQPWIAAIRRAMAATQVRWYTFYDIICMTSFHISINTTPVSHH